jgi:hypothetical protein
MSEIVNTIYLHYVWIGSKKLDCDCSEQSKHCIENIYKSFITFKESYGKTKKIGIVIHTDIDDIENMIMCKSDLRDFVRINRISVVDFLIDVFKGYEFSINGISDDLSNLFFSIFYREDFKVYMVASDVIGIMGNIMDYSENDDKGIILNLYIDTDDYIINYNEDIGILDKMYKNIKYFRMIINDMIMNDIIYNNNIISFFYNSETKKIHSDGAEEIESQRIKKTYLNTMVEKLEIRISDLMQILEKISFAEFMSMSMSMFDRMCIDIIIDVSGSGNLVSTHKKISNYTPETQYYDIYEETREEIRKNFNPVLLIIQYFTSSLSSYGSLPKTMSQKILNIMIDYYKSLIVNTIYLHYVWIGSKKLDCKCEESKHCVENIYESFITFKELYPRKKLGIVIHTDIVDIENIIQCKSDLRDFVKINRISVVNFLKDVFKGYKINYNGVSDDLSNLFFSIFYREDFKIYMVASDVIRIMGNIMDYSETDDNSIILNLYIDTDDFISFDKEDISRNYDILSKIYKNMKYYRLINNNIGYNNNIMAFFYNTKTKKNHSDVVEEIDTKIIKNTYLNTMIEYLNSKPIGESYEILMRSKNLLKGWSVNVILETTGSGNLVSTHKKLSIYIEEEDKIKIYEKQYDIEFTQKNNPLLLITPYITSASSSSGTELDINLCQDLLDYMKFYYDSLLKTKDVVVGGKYPNKYIKYLTKNKYIMLK